LERYIPPPIQSIIAEYAETRRMLPHFLHPFASSHLFNTSISVAPIVQCGPGGLRDCNPRGWPCRRVTHKCERFVRLTNDHHRFAQTNGQGTGAGRAHLRDGLQIVIETEDAHAINIGLGHQHALHRPRTGGWVPSTTSQGRSPASVPSISLSQKGGCTLSIGLANGQTALHSLCTPNVRVRVRRSDSDLCLHAAHVPACSLLIFAMALSASAAAAPISAPGAALVDLKSIAVLDGEDFRHCTALRGGPRARRQRRRCICGFTARVGSANRCERAAVRQMTAPLPDVQSLCVAHGKLFVLSSATNTVHVIEIATDRSLGEVEPIGADGKAVEASDLSCALIVDDVMVLSEHGTAITIWPLPERFLRYVSCSVSSFGPLRRWGAAGMRNGLRTDHSAVAAADRL
jgi:hypothetical protein